MLKPLFALLCVSFVFSQEKSEIIYKNETVIIKNRKDLEIETTNIERRLISKSKKREEYIISLPFDSFSEITDIKGKTTVLKTDKNYNLSSYAITQFDAEQENIFKSDTKIKQFVMPSVEDNSEIEFSYKTKLKQPRFLTLFRFQSSLKTRASKLEIITDLSVEIGYQLMGENQDKITFTKTTQDGKTCTLGKPQICQNLKAKKTCQVHLK